MLLARFPGQYIPSPWIKYIDGSGRHWCQPDGILYLRSNRLIIVEFKYQHTADAWKQLRLLYEPVITFLHPGAAVSSLEIVKWYDCAVAFPEPVHLIADIAEHHGKGFGVHIWKP